MSIQYSEFESNEGNPHGPSDGKFRVLRGGRESLIVNDVRSAGSELVQSRKQVLPTLRFPGLNQLHDLYLVTYK